jgi:hypothetical protein
MAARKAPQGIQAHPQIGAITEAILRGESLSAIRRWANPQPALSSLCHFKNAVLAPAMAHAEELKAVLPASVKAAHGISPNRPKQQPECRQQPEGTALKDVQAVQIIKDAITSAPLIAIREKRIEELDDRRRRMKLIIEERAAEMAGECPGGASGLLARDYKGKDADRTIYKVDTGLLSELREHEKQAAQELGQWQDSAGPQVAIQIVYPSAPGPAVARELPTINIGLPKR